MDAERQLKRQKALQEQQLIAGATVEGFEVTRDTAKAALVGVEGAGQRRRTRTSRRRSTNLGYATIYSPVDGVVLSRAVDVGQTVAVVVLGADAVHDRRGPRAHADRHAVSEADVGRLKEGMKATFTVDAFPGKTFEGIVRQVRNSPTTTQGVVTYDAVIDVDNADHALRPGMTANVTFVLEQVADAIKIPNAALRFKPTRDQMLALAREVRRQRARPRLGLGQRVGTGGRGSGAAAARGAGGRGMARRARRGERCLGRRAA